MAQVGSLYTSLTLESSSFVSGLKKAVDQTAKSAAGIEKSLNQLKAGVTGLLSGALASAVLGAGQRALEYASSLDEVSQQLGVTARDLQVYRYAASQVGVSQEEMDKGLQKFTRTLGEARAGNAQAIGTFRELGLSLDDIKNGDPHDVLLKTADGLAQIKDGANRAAPEVKIFGKAGQQLDTLLSGGSKAINDMARAAQDLGIVLSEDQIANADRTADKLTELKMVLEANIASAVADNAASIYSFVEALEKLIARSRDTINWLDQLKARFNVAEGEARANLGLGGAVRSAGRQEANQGREELYRLQVQQIRNRPPGFARGSLDALENFRGSKAGGKTYTDPSARAAAAAAADKAAREAEKQRQEALRQEDHFLTEKARSDDEFLGLRQQLTVDVRTQAALQHEQISRDLDAKARDLDLAVQEKQITAARAAELKALDARNADLQRAVVNRELDSNLDREALDSKTAALDNQRDLLSASTDLARTAKERRDIELKLLDLQYQEEKARQEAVIAERDRAKAPADDPVRRAAQQRLDMLPDLYGAQRAGIERRNAGPGGQYLDSLIQTAGEANEALQQVQVDGLKGLEDGLTDIVTGTGTVRDAFKHMADTIVADLARIALQRAVIEPLANALFGGGAGGGASAGSSLLGSLFGGGSGAGGFDISKMFNSGIQFDPKMSFATGGSFKVGGMGAADSKAFGVRLSPGEMVEVSKGDKPAGGNVHVHLNVQGGVDLATRSETYRLADAVRIAVKSELAQEQRRRA